MRERQLRWLQLVYNLPGLVGDVHRAVAWKGDKWIEPSHPFRAALRSVKWSVRRNHACLRAGAWPSIEPEHSYPGDIVLEPEDTFPLEGSVFTDGSVVMDGGAAAVQGEEEDLRTCKVLAPRSSTHCELIALTLALELAPPQVLTDSLASLLLLKHWGSWPPRKILCYTDRLEVRRLVHMAHCLVTPPVLGKVKAHDESGIRLGHPRAKGNDAADRWAKQAATVTGHPLWPTESREYGDPVELLDTSGEVVMHVEKALAMAWWQRRQRSRARARPFLEQLFPIDVPVDWNLSTLVFKRPVVRGDLFVHTVTPAVIKWMARVRAGCLTSRARLVGHGLASGSAQCLCCGEAEEDEFHILAGCKATGTSDWHFLLSEAWRAAAQGCGVDAPLPPLKKLGGPDRLLYQQKFFLQRFTPGGV